MAKVPPPGKGTKGQPPLPSQTLQNIDRPEAGTLEALNFKVPPEFKREFKTFAAVHGIKMVDVLREGFDLVKARRGG